MDKLILRPHFKEISFVLLICILLPVILGGALTYIAYQSGAPANWHILWIFDGVLTLPLVICLLTFGSQKIVVDHEKFQLLQWFFPVKTLYFREILQFQYDPWFKVKHHSNLEIFKPVLRFELSTGEYVLGVANYCPRELKNLADQLTVRGVKVAPTPPSDDAKLKVKKEQLRQALIYLAAIIGFTALYLGGCIK